MSHYYQCKDKNIFLHRKYFLCFFMFYGHLTTCAWRVVSERLTHTYVWPMKLASVITLVLKRYIASVRFSTQQVRKNRHTKQIDVLLI